MAQFRAKARAVDLLGKGQIADLPTAISELWKNGYDAYGDNLDAHLFMPGYMDHDHPIFILSDDGKGMNRTDVLDKWFVLGTDSKTRRSQDYKGPETLNKQPRVKMGEKGIGRLAVAYLGPQMLMLTKKQKFPLEVVYFDWRVLENYDLFLQDVNIPIRSIESLGSFQSIFDELKNEFLSNFNDDLKGEDDPWNDQQDLKKDIINETKALTLPDYIVEEYVAKCLEKPAQSHSTIFIVFDPEEQILELKNYAKSDENEDMRDDNSVRYTISSLVGLFNLFKTDNPEHRTCFKIHDENGSHDLLSYNAFFTPEDFNRADHLIKGTFDEYGEFSGTVRVYDKEIQHSYKPIRKKVKAKYGSFEIKLGYIAGQRKESRLQDEMYNIFSKKLNLFSGLYIYRDGFRVLPYGRLDNDFLEFEERRGRSAGYYFFAKRNMFGYIDISREENKTLRDKSSREGFINNAAYRDFKADLIGFFKDLAKKYFATDAEDTYREEHKEKLRNLAKAAEQEKEKEKEARKQFAADLKSYPTQLSEIQNQLKTHFEKLEEKNKQSETVYNEIQELLSSIEDCKVRLKECKLSSPTRFKPTDLQRKKFSNYQDEYDNANKYLTENSSLVKTARKKLQVHEQFQEYEAKNEFYKNSLDSSFASLEEKLQAVLKGIENNFANEKNRFLGEFDEKSAAVTPDKTNPREIEKSTVLLENIFSEIKDRMSERMSPYIDHLKGVNFDVNEDDLVGYYKIRFEEMEEEWNKTYEMAQLGIAVEIIDHQFNTLYAQLKDSIETIGESIPNDSKSMRKYKTMVTAFQHLEDNYKLLQPLYRTTGRIRKEVTGKELYEYANTFFDDRLKDNNIEFKISSKAKNWKEFTYESIFKPVIINVLNNAIYWLQPTDNREILLDSDGQKLFILNSGVPIENHLLEDIFKLFYSTRSKGRGIGLYLAKKSLNGIGFDIYATNDKKLNKLGGACFVVSKLNSTD